nr:hypothetical protein [Cupriavidus sp. IDO]
MLLLILAYLGRMHDPEPVHPARIGDIRDRTFAIEFLDPGVQAYAFTFG